MNFEVNDVTANILKDFQEAIDDALQDIKENQVENKEDLQTLNHTANNNDKQMKELAAKVVELGEDMKVIQARLEETERLLKRIALRPRRLR